MGHEELVAVLLEAEALMPLPLVRAEQGQIGGEEPGLGHGLGLHHPEVDLVGARRWEGLRWGNRGRCHGGRLALLLPPYRVTAVRASPCRPRRSFVGNEVELQ